MNGKIDRQAGLDTKTVFILYRTEALYAPAGIVYSLDRQSRPGAEGSSGKVCLQCSLWSYVAEAVLEYCRISFDLFSTSKPISFVTVDSEAKIQSVWYDAEQNLEAVWKVFTNEGAVTARLNYDDFNPSLPGLQAVFSLLQLPTPMQTNQIKGNAGRVIVIGSDFRKRVSDWLPGVLEQLQQPPQDDGYLSIDATEWIFVDVNATTTGEAGNEVILTPKDEMQHRVSLFSLHLDTGNNRGIYSGLMRLAERNLGLVSTLVQEIPMKEEANVASSSSMYGVELIHEEGAHACLKRLGLADRFYVKMDEEPHLGQSPGEGKRRCQRPPSGFSKTLGINWVTPRPADSHMIRYSIGAFRVTMAAVGNRASVCLAQFVLGGRSVVLAHRLNNQEHPSDQWSSHHLNGKNSGSNSTDVPHPSDTCFHAHSNGEAFLLLCHGSVMYLHVLAVTAPLAHPPVLPLFPSLFPPPLNSNLRVAPFTKNILHPTRLAPASARLVYVIAPKERALQQIERCTRYWPLREDSTVLGGNALASPLFEHLTKDFLEPSEYAACEQSINLILEFIQAHPVLKGSPKCLAATQPVAMALELDHLLRQYADISEEHSQLANEYRKKLETISLTVVGTGVTRRLFGLVETAATLLLSAEVPKESQLAKLSQEVGQKFNGDTIVASIGAIAGTSNDDEIPFGLETSNVQFSTCTVEAFLQHLSTVSRKPLQSRSEFAGVLSGTGKGPHGLYVGLVEET